MSNTSITAKVIRTGFISKNPEESNDTNDCVYCCNNNCDTCRTKYKVCDEDDNIIYFGIHKDIAVREAGFDFPS